jgi:type II secretory pathway pseudopilin PulG
VVAIIGVLAAIAVPTFLRNARKAKTSEAMVNIRRIYGSSRTYIIEEHHAEGGLVLRQQFPDGQTATPAASCCGSTDSNSALRKCITAPAEWSIPTWQALQFSLDDPHYFRYEYESTGAVSAGASSRFTARALGDLNCDGVWSTFEMIGEWSSLDHDVHGSGGFYQRQPLE